MLFRPYTKQGVHINKVTKLQRKHIILMAPFHFLWKWQHTVLLPNNVLNIWLNKLTIK